MNYTTKDISHNGEGTNRASYSITGMPIPTLQNNSYQMQMSLYDRSIKYSPQRQTPTGEYKGGH